MSSRTARRLLWLVALFTVPLPMLQFGASIPVSRYLLLAGVTLGLMVAEGAAGLVVTFFLLFLGYALVYAGGLWLVAWLVTRLVGRASARALGPLVVALSVLALLWSTLFDVYTTPFAATSGHANLLNVIR
jgi:hypothetical protein